MLNDGYKRADTEAAPASQQRNGRQSNLAPDVVNQGDFRIAKSRLVKTLFTSISGGGAPAEEETGS
ncbi:hypothetical protein Trydic_g12507, partial [Trypoxylus dichotomus]